MMTLTFTRSLALLLSVLVLGAGSFSAAGAYFAGGRTGGAGCVAMMLLGGTLFFSGACLYLAMTLPGL